MNVLWPDNEHPLIKTKSWIFYKQVSKTPISPHPLFIVIFYLICFSIFNYLVALIYYEIILVASTRILARRKARFASIVCFFVFNLIQVSLSYFKSFFYVYCESMTLCLSASFAKIVISYIICLLSLALFKLTSVILRVCCVFCRSMSLPLSASFVKIMISCIVYLLRLALRVCYASLRSMSLPPFHIIC